MARHGSDSLIHKGRTVPGWETKLRRFNNSCAEFTTATQSCYAGTVENFTDTSDPDMDITISLWFKLPIGLVTDVGFFSFNDATIPYALLGGHWDAATKLVTVSWGSSAVRYVLTHGLTPDGKWHNLIVSAKRLTGEVSMWVDNNWSAYGVAAPQGGLAQPFSLGVEKGIAFGSPYVKQFEGMIDEVAFFDWGISAMADANILYNGGLPPDLNDDQTYIGAASLNKSQLAVWLRWERDPSNGRNFTSPDTWNASETTIGTTAPMTRGQLKWQPSYLSPFGPVTLPFVSHATTHQTQPDYAAIADAWGDWSKGLTFPAGGTRYALGSGKEVRTLAPGLMPQVESGWGYHQGVGAWITLNTTEPFSTPFISEDVITLLSQDQVYPKFNEELQRALDVRPTRLLRGLFARKV